MTFSHSKMRWLLLGKYGRRAVTYTCVLLGMISMQFASVCVCIVIVVIVVIVIVVIVIVVILSCMYSLNFVIVFIYTKRVSITRYPSLCFQYSTTVFLI